LEYPEQFIPSPANTKNKSPWRRGGEEVKTGGKRRKRPFGRRKGMFFVKLTAQIEKRYLIPVSVEVFLEPYTKSKSIKQGRGGKRGEAITSVPKESLLQYVRGKGKEDIVAEPKGSPPPDPPKR